MTEIRLNYSFNQPLVQGYSSIRTTVIIQQSAIDGYSTIRHNMAVMQPLIDGYSKIRLNLIMLQTLHPVLPEGPVSTNPFPGFGNSTSDPSVPAGKNPFNTALPGLTYSVHKKPYFKTNIKEAANGNENRNSLMPMPRWDFEFNYEFLEDSSGADSSLKTIMGFFLARNGSYDTFLVKDPDDYLVEAGDLGTADGTTTAFYFVRGMGEFSEIVGQVDTSNTINIYTRLTEDVSVPGTGPYELTFAGLEEIYSIFDEGTQLTEVSSAPADHQFSVDYGTGVVTFNSAQAGVTMTIDHRDLVDSADYTVTLPNQVVFDSAPADGTVITADFQFYFACRFAEDQLDFEKFYDQLWSLQTCNFRSVIQ